MKFMLYYSIGSLKIILKEEIIIKLMKLWKKYKIIMIITYTNNTVINQPNSYITFSKTKYHN